MPREKKTRVAAARRAPLGRRAWLDAARIALIRDGIRGVEIGRLARTLRVTRGGFYWFFSSRAQLLEELLGDWERTSASLFEGVLKRDSSSGLEEFDALIRLWVNERDYDPAWDAAIRNWAQTSSRVAKVVHRVDEKRVDVLRQVFLDLGYKEIESLVRARITYYHQVGYYALGIRQTAAERLELLPHYRRVLIGRD